MSIPPEQKLGIDAAEEDKVVRKNLFDTVGEFLDQIKELVEN